VTDFEFIFNKGQFFYSHKIAIRAFNVDAVFIDVLQNGNRYKCLTISILSIEFVDGIKIIRFSLPEFF
jgi:hypothetical protein